MAEGVFLGHFWGVFGVLDKCLNSRHLGIVYGCFGGVLGVFLRVFA